MKKQTTRMLRFFSRMISMLLVVVLLAQDALGSGSITLAGVVEQEIETQSTETQSTESQGIENEPEAGDVQSDSDEETPDGESLLETGEEPKILLEVEALRDQREKHYRLSDGSILATGYGMDVHYEDENGKWKDIDNRFLYEASDDKDSMTGYATAEGDVRFKFASETGSGEIVRATSGKYSVGFELVTEPKLSGMQAEELSEENTALTRKSPVTDDTDNTKIADSPITLMITGSMRKKDHFR